MALEISPAHDLPLLIVPKRHADDRGWFSEVFHEQRLRELNCRFVQDNQSSSTRIGTIRGFHFQRPPAAQAKLISILKGRVLDVAIDIRRGSPTFGEFVSIELSAELGQQFYIPTGFAHGYMTLEHDVLVMYKATAYYAPSLEDGIRWNDPDIAFPWPFREAEVIRSEKDGCLPLLKDLDSPFPYNGHPLKPPAVCNFN
jgi:dTDP-4-dehydrorhamnose 3,5-epimerase